MSDDKHELAQTAETLDGVAVFADYLRVLALGSNEDEKADHLEEQAGDLREWAKLYRTAADAS